MVTNSLTWVLFDGSARQRIGGIRSKGRLRSGYEHAQPRENFQVCTSQMGKVTEALVLGLGDNKLLDARLKDRLRKNAESTNRLPRVIC